MGAEAWWKHAHPQGSPVNDASRQLSSGDAPGACGVQLLDQALRLVRRDVVAQSFQAILQASPVQALRPCLQTTCKHVIRLPGVHARPVITGLHGRFAEVDAVPEASSHLGTAPTLLICSTLSSFCSRSACGVAIGGGTAASASPAAAPGSPAFSARPAAAAAQRVDDP